MSADAPRKPAIRTAVAGVTFALLFAAALVLVDRTPKLGSAAHVYQAFYSSSENETLVTVGLYVIPFAGIAFLWFMMALRELVATVSPRRSDMSRGLQLASGVAFLCLVFCGTAAGGGVALLLNLSSAPAPTVDVMRSLNGVGYALVFVFGVRMAGMFAITTTSLAWAAGLLPRWLMALSYLMAAFLLINTTDQPATLLLYPAWVLLVSLAVWWRAVHHAAPGPSDAAPTDPVSQAFPQSPREDHDPIVT
jgi:hypothetical protein